MLSNAFTQGKRAEKLVTQHVVQMAAQLTTTIMTGTRVIAINTGDKEVPPGSTFADDVAGAGHRVTVIEPNPRPLAALAAPALPAALLATLDQALHRVPTRHDGPQASRKDNALEITLAGGPTDIELKPSPVIVKTVSYPLGY